MIDLATKKVYCPKCQKLSHIKASKTGEKSQYTCVKCNYVMWQKEGLNWKYLRVEK